MDARDLCRLEIPAALVPRLLSNMRAPRLPGAPPPILRPQPKTCGAGSRRPASPRPWRTPFQWWLTQCHTWWERASTPPRLIEDICSVIVGVGDRGDGEAYVTLFGPQWRVDAAMAIVRVWWGGAWSLPRRLKERGFPMG